MPFDAVSDGMALWLNEYHLVTLFLVFPRATATRSRSVGVPVPRDKSTPFRELSPTEQRNMRFDKSCTEPLLTVAEHVKQIQRLFVTAHRASRIQVRAVVWQPLVERKFGGMEEAAPCHGVEAIPRSGSDTPRRPLWRVWRKIVSCSEEADESKKVLGVLGGRKRVLRGLTLRRRVHPS